MSSPLDDEMEASEGKWISERDQLSQARWEESVVKRILNRVNKPEAIKELARRVKDLTGESRLFFSEFQEMFPSFPLWLHCYKIPYVFQTTVEELFKKPTKTKLYKQWLDSVDMTPEAWVGMPVGVVFEWLHSGGQFKIIHNYSGMETRNTRITLPFDETYGLVHIQNLDGLLEEINWSPSKFE